MPFKTFNVPSFFASVATVLAILAMGFGGGVMMSGVLSDSAHRPNKIERQAAREAKPETKPADAPIVPAAPVAAPPGPATPAPAQAAAADAAPAAPAEPRPQPAIQQAQSGSQPPTQSPPVAQPQTATQPTPSPGPERPVSLAQPPPEQQFDPSQLSRREQARYWRHQRREERAQRREERRKQYAERRQQDYAAEGGQGRPDRAADGLQVVRRAGEVRGRELEDAVRQISPIQPPLPVWENAWPSRHFGIIS